MNVTFYFDPSCPFSWITSRWLLVAQSQDSSIEINWQPFALALKNNETTQTPDESHYAQSHRDSLRVLRIMLAAHQNHDFDLLKLYSAFGMQKHIMFEEFTDEVVQNVLTELSLPSSLINEADSAEYDEILQDAINTAIEVVGNDIGVPTLVFTLEDGTKQGYFGPVLQSLPSKEDSLKIWNGLSRLATTKEFYELKRNRPSGLPDTPSTARC